MDYKDKTKDELISELTKSQKTLKGLFENMVEGFAYCKMLYEKGEARDFVYIMVNDSFETLTGLKDVTGKRVSEVIPGIRESDPALFEIYNRVALTRKPERFEMYVEALDLWFSVSMYSPEKEFFVSLFDVITQRKKTEEALACEQYLMEAIMSNLPDDQIYFKNLQSHFIRINKSLAESFGLTDPEQATGKTDFDFHTPEHARQAYKDEQTIIQTGQPLTKEERLVHANSPDLWVYVIKLPLRNNEGKIIGTFGISRDISKRKLAEEALSKSEERFRLIAQYANDAIITIDSKRNIIGWNRGAEKIFGYKEPEIIGQSLNLIIPEDYHELHSKSMKRLEMGGEKHIIGNIVELDGLKKDGTVFPVELSLSEWETSEGRFFTGIIRDKTNRK